MNGIPLLIKKYDNGDFTQTFLKDIYQYSIKLSKPRGRGMSLDEMPAGKIIMFAGGTGIHPFCDLIDLIYKDLLISQNSRFSSAILKSDPLIAKKPF